MILFFILLFILWTVFGSFGGVIIERWREGFARDGWKEVFGGRSYCPWCNGKTLIWWQLVPLVGWLMQKGKCFRCKQPIPGRYCRLEVVMGIVFVLTWWWIVESIAALSDMYTVYQLMLWCLINWALVLIIIADLRYYELNVYVWFIVLGLWLITIAVWVIFEQIAWQPVLIGTLILTVVFAIIYVTAKRYATKKAWKPAEWFGFGDVMMAFALWLLLPPVLTVMPSMHRIVVTQWLLFYLVLSSVIGIGYWAVSAILNQSDGEFLPFLPAMIVAYWLIIAGSWLLQSWFMGM